MNSSISTTANLLVNMTQSTPNNNSWPYVALDPKQGLILFLIALPGTLANVVAFITTWKLIRTQAAAPNYLILALNFTDFYGIALCTLPTLLCYLYKDWVGGEAMCNFQGVSTMFASLASGIFATVMAIDRMLAVWKPFIYKRHVTVQKTLIIVIVTWILAMLVALLPLLGIGDFVRNLTGTFCTVNWFAKSTADKVYSVGYAVIGMLLVVVVVICNVRIVVSLLQLRRKRLILHGVDASQINSERENITSQKSEMQLVKSIGAISVLFIICWFPFMIRIICNLTGLWVDAWADVQVSRLLLLNFVLDPFLYTLSRKQCRDIVKGWLCCCCSKGSKRSLLSRLFYLKRKKRGSTLSSGQTGSGSNTHTLIIPISLVKTGSKSGTPAQSNENSIADVVIHSSGKEDSSAAKSDHAPNTGIENNQDCSRTAEISPGDMKSDEKLLQRHYSTSAMEAKAHRKEVTKSLPDLKEAGEENKNEEIQVDVAYMYNLAFQKHAIDQQENSSL